MSRVVIGWLPRHQNERAVATFQIVAVTWLLEQAEKTALQSPPLGKASGLSASGRREIPQAKP